MRCFVSKGLQGQEDRRWFSDEEFDLIEPLPAAAGEHQASLRAFILERLRGVSL